MTDADHLGESLHLLIPFGKFKGRLLKDALHDRDLFEWVKRLSQSPIRKSAEIGHLYLFRLEMRPGECHADLYLNNDLRHLRDQIAMAREQISELDVTYTVERQAVERIQAKLFLLLRRVYERLDSLRIQVDYRRRFLQAILENDIDKAEVIAEEEQHARSKNHDAYEEAGQSVSGKTVLDEQERAELRAIYRKLAALYHPDKYASDRENQDSYIELMKQINQAKDAGDISILRDIAENPNQFLESTGRRALDLVDSSESESLQLHYTKLQERIEELQRRLDELRSSSDYELWKLCEQDPDLLITIAEEQIRDLDEEARKLEDECSALAGEINRNLEPDSPLRI